MAASEQQSGARRREFYQIGGSALLVLLGVWIGALIFSPQGDDYWLNITTEGLGVAVTILVLNRFAAVREEWREQERLKKRLVREASSSSNETAKAAIDWLRYENWLIGEDGLLCGVSLARASLKNADLWKANLRDADLREADLTGAELSNVDFSRANLREAELCHAMLKHANFHEATLRNTRLMGAILRHARLQGATLRGANLTEADLTGADLCGANLRAATLTGVQGLEKAIFDTETILPDGTPYHHGVDWAIFTAS